VTAVPISAALRHERPHYGRNYRNYSGIPKTTVIVLLSSRYIVYCKNKIGSLYRGGSFGVDWPNSDPDLRFGLGR